MSNAMTFEQLAEQIKTIHHSAQISAVGAVNRMLTLRNWLIGYYIVEFEQHGEERAQYGEKLLKKLEEKVNEKGLNNTLFKNSRRFYLVYPQVGMLFVNSDSPAANRMLPNSPMASDLFIPMKKSPTPSDKFTTNPETLVSRLSFSHIVEILPIEDPFERFFYEFECMRCCWSVKELRRQIATALYFRAGVSKKPELLLQKTIAGSPETTLSIKDPFAFEFLGLDTKMAVDESDMEQALMDAQGSGRPRARSACRHAGRQSQPCGLL